MDVNRLLRIIDGSSRVASGDGLDGTACVDMVLFSVAVDPAGANSSRKELMELLGRYPVKGRLEKGKVSYREIANTLRISEEHSLRLMAIGKHLHLWSIDTPADDLHKLRDMDTAALVREDAMRGKVMISRYMAADASRKGAVQTKPKATAKAKAF